MPATDSLPHPYRYQFADNAKALGILLVVLGHARGISAWMVDLIFSFHIPLFFFLSGFLLKPDRLAESMAGCWRRVAKNLLIPYLVFFAIAYVYWLATRHIGIKAALFGDLHWFDPLMGLVTGIGSKLYIDTPLWFFPCLISTVLIYHLARHFIDSGSALFFFNMTALLAIILSPLVDDRLPWGLDNMWVALAFYAVGQACREKWYEVQRWFQLSTRVKLLSMLAVAVAWSVLALFNGRVDLNSMQFGKEILLYLPIAYAGTAGLLMLSSLLPATRALRWISDNALVIFPLHMLVFSVARGGLVTLKIVAADYHYTIVWALALTALAILVAVPAARVMRILLPGTFIRRAGA
ncbi:MAG TPA: acyltransferase family protein [Rhodocyclaceae bacterium]|nr:acyltransferase family protein [Rhodocyclaceae bacterium]